LKRALKRQEVTIEEVGEASGFMTPASINPEPIPIQVRVLLVGSPDSYALLHTDDEDFRELFKVKVDFDVQQPRAEESPAQYGRFIARLCREEGLRHFGRDAVAAVLEQACRWAEHQKKLSVRFGDLADLVREASHWAGQDDQAYVARHHVQKAIEERVYRTNLAGERLRELIAEGTLMVDVAGSMVGQINALSLYDIGDSTFALPARITARVFLGEAGIVNIEREVELSEEVHSKGVLILSGYLGGRYAHEVPLSLSATLCFEQSYDEVAGDSASAAELVALLSALSEMPIDQGVALTGSVNQRGELQAISGVNEKIEGFYAVCQTLGLTTRQGVIVPRPNLRHLMLNEDVVEAVTAGRFNIYAVSTVDEALEILIGCPAGGRQPDGRYPAGSIDAAVLHRLHDMHDRLHALETKRKPHRAKRSPRTSLP
jgi:lon-related putative ATP-dependent protease